MYPSLFVDGPCSRLMESMHQIHKITAVEISGLVHARMMPQKLVEVVMFGKEEELFFSHVFLTQYQKRKYNMTIPATGYRQTSHPFAEREQKC